MSPLEKARLAKTSGKKSPKKAKAKIPQWKAPADFKPHFLEVLVKTEKDGLLGSSIRAIRYTGRYDPQAPDKKKADLGSYDPATLQGLLGRLSATTYFTNAAKRLPADTTFRLLLRINRKSADGTLSVAFKQIWMAVKNKTSGRTKAEELEKSDPKYRAFRKSNRILPAAFKNVLMPPKRTRGARVKEQDDE